MSSPSSATTQPAGAAALPESILTGEKEEVEEIVEESGTTDTPTGPSSDVSYAFSSSYNYLVRKVL
jgi:hypothetical protein